MSQRAVSRILSALARLAASVGVTTIPLVPSSLTGSSDLPGDSADGPSAPDREVPIRWPPYLVLLRAGFCLPPVLPRARCALTAPFHPYLVRPGGMFSVPLSFRSPWPGVTRRTALRSSDFPLRLRALRVLRHNKPQPVTPKPEGRRRSGRLARCDPL